MNDVLWAPTGASARDTNIARFRRLVRDRFGGPPDDSYAALHQWTLDHRGAFWAAVWDFAGVVGDPGTARGSPAAAYVPGPHMTAARWFPGAGLNFAENLLRPSDLSDPRFAAAPAVIYKSERGDGGTLSRAELYARATSFAGFLRSRGVRAGDRVAAVVPNGPVALVAMLGAAAVGAVWSACSPDYGEDAIVDRFG